MIGQQVRLSLRNHQPMTRVRGDSAERLVSISTNVITAIVAEDLRSYNRMVIDAGHGADWLVDAALLPPTASEGCNKCGWSNDRMAAEAGEGR